MIVLASAFPQPDSVVVVDPQAGGIDRIPLPGLNEQVTWLADGVHVLVCSATQTWLVDVDRRSAGHVDVSGWDVAPLVGGSSGMTTLTLPGQGDEPPVIGYYDDPGTVRHGHRTVDAASAGPYRMSDLYPRAWRHGDSIAAAGSGQVGSRPGDFVFVIDDRSGTVTHVLDLGTGQDRNKGCCRVLRMDGPQNVLISSDQDGVLDWDLTTGTVTRRTALRGGPLSLEPTGCDWTITVGGVTSSCIT